MVGSMSSKRSLFAVTVAFTLTLALSIPSATAFKPYTHGKTGAAVLDDLADGNVTIAGQEYPVNQAVVDALTNWPAFYNAGVIGPDGFPDLTFGQGVIHPEDTGLWLRHVFSSAWAAQSDSSYDATQKSQILAFGYGYLMHAAGDTWAHTLVNDFARGTFPGVGEILTNAQQAAIAIRHIIVEGYIGDATTGYDGNRDRGPAPGGDTSDDSSDALEFPTVGEFGGVSRFIFETLIDPAADTPTPDRGPIIDKFLDLRAGLVSIVNDFNPDPVGTLTDAVTNARNEFDSTVAQANVISDLIDEFNNCDLLDFTCSRTLIFAEIVIQAAILGFTASIDALFALGDLVAGAIEAAAETVALAVDALLDAYLVAWIDDIDDGLRAWPELGLATTVALFDPQARRDLQNEECQFNGAENTLTRANCESAIGAIDVLLNEIDPFVNDHLLSMLGAPDFVGDVRSFLQEVLAEIDAVIGPVLGVFNPLREAVAIVKQFAIDLITDLIEQTLGIDLDLLKSFVTSPTSWLNVTTIDLELPLLGTVQVDLFRPDDRPRLDGYLGLEAGSHVPDDPPVPGFPFASSKLADDAEFGPGDLAIFDNVVTMGKLLLLDGAALDQLMSNLTGRPYSFYATQPNANIMLTPLPGVPGASSQMWLQSIDGDHAWRSNGLPTFNAPSAGEGNFPLWESCILRDDVFRTVFTDWENGPAQFPDLGDPTSTDPNDPAPPTSSVTPLGNVFIDGTVYLGPGATLRINAADDYWPSSEIDVTVKITDSVGADVTTVGVNGDTLALDAFADGILTVETTASDSCRTETTTTQSFFRDTTPPVLDLGGPYAGVEGDIIPLDGTNTSDAGSGVADSGWTSTDPLQFTQGEDPVDFVPADDGSFTVTLTASDNLGNTAAQDTTVLVSNATPTIDAGLDQSVDEGDLVDLAVTFHDQGTLDTHTATVDWDDGTGVQAALVTETPFGPPGSTAGLDGTISGTHVYADDGVYDVAVCVTDDDGASACDVFVVSAANVAPAVTIDMIGDGPAFFLPHVAVPLAGSFNDRGTLDTHTATVNWDDGTITTSIVTESPFGPPGSVDGLDGSIDDVHAWAGPGFYDVVLTVVDDDGGVGQAGQVSEVVTPIEALQRTLTDLRALAGDDDVAEALKDLQGPPSNGNPSSGALHKLAHGQHGAALVKIGRALEDLELATVDTGFAQLVLAQIAESVAADLEIAKIASLPNPNKGQQRQLDRIAASMTAGRTLVAAGDYVAAVNQFHDAATRAG